MIQAVIMAAGKSTRTWPLTLTMPKPLLKVMNKEIIKHNLDAMQGLVNEVIVIVGYKKEMIQSEIGNKYGKLKIRYVEQKRQLGTGHALKYVEQLIKDKFIVIGGDDIFSKRDIRACLKHKYAVLGCGVESPDRFGVFVVKGKEVKKVVEKPKKFVSDIANTGLYVFDKSVFDFKLKKSQRGEYEIVDYINMLAKKEKVICEKAKGHWLSVGYPWDLIEANNTLVSEIKSDTMRDIRGKVEKNVTIKGELKVGKGTEILSGTYIKGNVVIGENCRIGPNSYLRGNTSIGNGCHIGQAVEIKNSIIMDNAKVPHLSYIGDSVIGNNSNLGAGTITANLKHDNKNVRSAVKGKPVDTGRRKLGTIIADDVHTGINTTIYPGRKIWPGLGTLPGEVVDKDKMA
ncbi:MAG: sugar phosphate nucleotidyltransferase [Candidatus Scalindua sp.]|jgi:bifunctional UDP-N-acetylglucosamine pyrophosphorylase/glucosamine-1-phosphate N-acetyltransferase|nr:sugar phosphate nucleotidyltransferase [Candidatus Scalindua sp.]MDV5165874.1 sugar phosphate nucleotidyltransferase [Candidatus Scalindua sp.]